MRGLLQTWLSPFAACRSGKTGSFLNEISPLQWGLKQGKNGKVSKTLGKEVVSWGGGSKHGGGSEQRLLLWERFLFLLSKAQRGRRC